MKVTHKQHFVHAALFWTVIGSMMGFFGMRWVLFGFSPKWAGVILLLCVGGGVLKGEYAIGRAARKAIDRIDTLPRRSLFHEVFAKNQWLLIFGMMMLGMLIRFSGLHKSYRGVVLVIIGVALLWASRYFWNAATRPEGLRPERS